MRRATVTLDDELESALNDYLQQQDAPASFTTIVQSAVREYLSRRGVAAPAARLRITPAKKGSGKRDVSARHDYYLAKR